MTWRAGRWGWALALAALAAPGCGLTLDYDPPTDAGFDAARDATVRLDAGSDAGPIPDCRTSADCDDGEACNGLELCLEGACVPGEPVVCGDGNVCNGIEQCVGGSCVSTEPVACPSDSDPCNGVESCDPVLGCVPGTPIDCDDGIACTHDGCGAGGDCLHERDSTLCTDGPGGRCEETGCQYDFCDATTCRPGPCEAARCDAGTCVRTPRCGAGQMCCADACVTMGCTDDNACTADACGIDGCLHMPRNGMSSCDGNPCTVGDLCASGTCVPGAVAMCSDGNPCTTDVCNPTTGGCTTMPASGAPCSDGDACTAGDHCSSGVCVRGPDTIVCSSPSPCLASSCDAAFGCIDTPLPIGTTCGTDRLCSPVGTCECRPGTADCDIDGTCECDGTCSASDGACVARCTNDGDCAVGGFGSVCCIATGMCFDPICLACCMGGPDGGVVVPLDGGRDGGARFDAGTGTGVVDGGPGATGGTDVGP